MDKAPTPRALSAVVAPDGERLSLAGNDLYIHYPNGLGRSKLKLPFAKQGTTHSSHDARTD